MASQPAHRREKRGNLSLFLRLVTALAVALISLPALNVSAQADDVAPDTASETAPATTGTDATTETSPEPDAAPAEEPPPPPEPAPETSVPEEPAADEQPGPAADKQAPPAPKAERDSGDATRRSGITSLVPLVTAAVTDSELEAADYIVADEKGANDEPGQKDLTQFFGFDAAAGSVKIGWSWDEIKWTGENTGDACALFDTDADGKANYAVCVTIDGDPATQVDTAEDPSPRFYSCGDDKVDRCTSPVALISSGTASSIDCEVSQTDTDPFPAAGQTKAGDDYPTDTSALCTIPLTEMTGGTPRLINVCSFPSQQPNSDPSDCVLIPRDAFVTISKVVTPAQVADGTDFGFEFTAATGTPPAPITLEAGQSQVVPVRSGVKITVSEVVPAGWRLVSAVCTNGQTIDNILLRTTQQADGETTCTFTNTRTASVTVTKSWVINGTPYTNTSKPAGYSATLQLTDQQAPTFGTTYTGYTIGDSVTIGEQVSVPDGCTNVATGDTGTRTLAGGANTYAITNTVTCPATVKVDKSWVINGTAYAHGFQPNGYSATLSLTKQVSPSFGNTYGGYVQGEQVTIGEVVNVPEGCDYDATGDLGVKTLAKGANTYSITNTVTCDASVRVEKAWVINGAEYDDGDQPNGYSATLSLTGQVDPDFGTVYDDYTEGDEVTIGELASVPAGCRNAISGDTGEKTLARGANVFTITNTVTCAATVEVDKDWVINGAEYDDGDQPNGYSADLTLTDQVDPDFDTVYAGYVEGDEITIGEDVTLPPGCDYDATGDLGDHTLDRGANVFTVTNTVTCPASWQLDKSSAPASGTTVEPGEQVTYTLTATNTSYAVVDDAVVTDDLGDVLDNATLTEPLAAGLSLVGTELTWDVPTLSAVGTSGSTATVSYTVTVDADEWNETLRNVATPSGDGGGCVEVGGCETEHPTPGWSLTKSSDPGSGETVLPGETVTYTLTATNTSDGVVDAAVVTDDLGDVLDNATLVEPLAAGLSLNGTELTWDVPTLQPQGAEGDQATVSYTVTVGAEQWDQHLRNVATPENQGGECATVDGCQTDHPTPGWELTKVSDPASGSEVKPGSQITYTLTAVNTSDAVVEGALAEDDLSAVLDNASIDDSSLDDALSLDGDILTWAIPTLLPGETASVSYTVTVDGTAFDVVLENVVAPASGGGVCVEADDCTTTHDTPEIAGEDVVVPKPRPRPPATVLPATGAPQHAELLSLLGAVGLVLGGLLLVTDRVRRGTRRV